MGIMAGGGETTREDRIIYSEEVQGIISRAVGKIRGGKWDGQERAVIEWAMMEFLAHVEREGL